MLPETAPPPFCCPLAPPPQPARTSDSAIMRPATANDFERPVVLNLYTPSCIGTQVLGPTLARLDSRARVSVLCYTRVRSALNMRFMRPKDLRLRAPGMQTLVD